jgi:hypothetical protein
MDKSAVAINVLLGGGFRYLSTLPRLHCRLILRCGARPGAALSRRPHRHIRNQADVFEILRLPDESARELSRLGAIRM